MLRNIALYIGTLSIFMAFAVGCIQSAREIRSILRKKRHDELDKVIKSEQIDTSETVH